MWELDCEEGWVPKNWCFWTVVLEKTLESPLDCKEIQTVHSNGDHPWVFFGRNDTKAETPVLWPPHVRSWLIWKDSDAGRDWGQEEKRTTEDEMASPTRWTWVWVNSGSWWWTGRPVLLWFMGSQTVGQDWATELNCIHIKLYWIMSFLVTQSWAFYLNYLFSNVLWKVRKWKHLPHRVTFRNMHIDTGEMCGVLPGQSEHSVNGSQDYQYYSHSFISPKQSKATLFIMNLPQLL